MLHVSIPNILNRYVPLELLQTEKVFSTKFQGDRVPQRSTLCWILWLLQNYFQTILVSDVVFVRTSANVADEITSPMIQAVWQNILWNAYTEIRAEQWIATSGGVD